MAKSIALIRCRTNSWNGPALSWIASLWSAKAGQNHPGPGFNNHRWKRLFQLIQKLIDPVELYVTGQTLIKSTC
ncbi:hypothetical protein P2C08_16420 [Xanthomonas perforans]|uniref:hypothetical protein n=1 Tax=Xanthomonas TaxID=338 RepID=UPI000ADF449B|nr:hypothetical protein [Xanthomonas euvesicatoria]MCC8726336.1 hypothetical protein [Xanthomonas euvesicatoria pv. euvesicatoria]MCC8743266.1 hypothetical protein [Xanthomonas euvesicatoria pv. euvesicatoria]MCC8786140.1 hypothetical protein [Xanthomonas euvesicatoria pv. euvesicatoria]MDC9641980.1 hypothetical protein [Xanthomonas euvesicatoria]MDM4814376.1 hypothetical protein [Xanthomonas euvesicatoria]